MSVYRLLITIIVVVIAVVPAAGGTSESDKDEAKKHFDVAIRLYEVDDYKGAVTEFETSVRLYPTKNGYFNLANCYKSLHRYDEALSTIDALDQRFGGELDANMQREKERLRSLIESLVGALRVTVSPTDATVLINGKRLAPERVGMPLRLGPGEYRIEARLDGYASESKSVTLHSLQTTSVNLSLVELEARLLIDADVSGATVIIDGEMRGEAPLTVSVVPGEHLVEISVDGYAAQMRTVEAAPDKQTRVAFSLSAPSFEATAASVPEEDVRRSSLRGLKIAGIVGTATTAVAAGVFYGLAAKYASDFSEYDEDYKFAETDTAANRADAKRRDAANTGTLFATMGLAFGISAGVLGVSTIVLTILDRKAERQTETSRVSMEKGGLTVSF